MSSDCLICIFKSQQSLFLISLPIVNCKIKYLTIIKIRLSPQNNSILSIIIFQKKLLQMRKTCCLYTKDYDRLLSMEINNMMINDYYSCIKWEMK